jgi:4-amino-4-deoxy-L-arabinose transferase-like glycosyltransferase
VAIVAGLTVLAAVLRFATLDAQSFSADEAVTAGVVLPHDFIQMLKEVAGGESTPPVYYVAAWFWSKVFGTGEAGLRALSALFGTALVPVAYALGAKLASRRVGVVLCALVAVNPMLVWYSQEARAYSLFALVSAASVLLFAYVLESPTRRRLALWAIASALTLATHYFGLVLIAAEALWLLARWRRLREVWWAVAAVAVAGLALAPLAIHQARDDHTGWIAEIPLGDRLHATADEFLVGPTGNALAHVVAIATALVVAGLVLAVWRARGRERHGAGVAAALGLAVVLVPLGLTLVDADRVLAKNLLLALVPLALVVAVGFGARRSGLVGVAATVGLCAVSVLVVVRVAESPKLQRTDYRGAANLIRAGPSAAVVARGNASSTLELYLGQNSNWENAPVHELVVVGAWLPDDVSHSFPGFEPMEQSQLGWLFVTRLRSSRARRVEQTARARLEQGVSLLSYEPSAD